MKRVLVASILGLAASVASSYGQAQIFFDTYAISPSADFSNWQVQYAGGGIVQAGDGLVANLLWSYTINSVTSTGDAGLQVPINDLGATYGAGWIQYGNVATGTSYSIDNTPITLTIQVWKASEGTYANAITKGEYTWLDTVGYSTLVSDKLHDFAGPILVVPEPTTLALAGLGAAALLALRRR